MYSLLVKHLLMPAYFRLHKDERIPYLRRIEKSQWRSPEEIRQEQLKRIKVILAHAYAEVPFYRNSMDACGIHPDEVLGLDDFSKLPFLTKHDIQNSLDSLKARNYPQSDMMLDSSGGSTGAPTNFYVDLRRRYRKYSFQYRHDRWAGWDFGKKTGIVWGGQYNIGKFRKLRDDFLTKYLYRQFSLDAFQLTDEKISRYIQLLNRERPAVLLAYTNAIFLAAKYIKDSGAKIYRPQGIIVSAETLTEEKRNLVEAAFGCPVLNRYGSREIGLAASECMHKKGLHIASENVYLEVIRNGEPAGPGESGEIVVTDLHNFAMPLIRYKMGDVGALSDETCPCGRGLPLLKEVSGRTGDFFVNKSGRLIHGEYFTHLFYGIPNIKFFRVTQETVDDINVKIVPSGPLSQAVLNKIEHEIKAFMGEVAIKTEMVDALAPVASGKYMFTISKVGRSLFG